MPENHSRWLTFACRMLRLYVATPKPTWQLKTVVEFIIKVYAPLWFTIKRNSSSTEGARHFLKMAMFSRYLPMELKNIMDECLERNAFFAHTENILLAMLSDDRTFVRKLAIRRILNARTRTPTATVRTFEIPSTLNLDASDILDLVCWQNETIFEPPLTRNMSDENLQEFLKNPTSITFKKFPCHTQAVERSVKTVTEASSSVCSAARRDGVIHSKLISRKRNPGYTSKKAFKIRSSINTSR